jgi:enediyne biosynthesis protein E4
MRKRRVLGLWSAVSVALIIAVGAVGAFVYRERALRAELVQARVAFDAGRYAVASDRLSRLAPRWSGDGEVFWLLGESELKRGRREEALANWSKVTPASPFFGRAALQRATNLINTGRYTPAEDLLLQALADPARTPRYALERALTRVYRFEGRYDEVRRVVRGSWSRSPTQDEDLKELWNLDHSPEPVEAWKLALERADAEDDRVWLGRANQAIMTGCFTDAASWLARCADRRPDDPAVWQARLDLAVATNDEDGFWTAAAHLPAERFDANAILSFRAWLALVRHDTAAEQRELKAMIDQDPANVKAIERLAALLVESGRSGEARELHHKKAAIDGVHDEYRKSLMKHTDLLTRASELAKLTAKLNRTFDSQAWSILADARLSEPAAASPEPSAANERQSPLPPAQAARAIVLSAPYDEFKNPESTPSAMLDFSLSDLRPAGQLQAGVKSPSPGRPAVSQARRSVPTFDDDAEKSGLRFTFDNGQTHQHLLPETMSGGVALIDFDGDGWLDVYCAQGGELHAPADGKRAGGPDRGDRLFRNRGDGTFTDVTEASRIAAMARSRDYGLGVAVGDYDNDGKADLFLSRLATYALYRNRGDGTFEDVTERAGLAGRRDNPTSAAFADLDNDGDLDLYVCHYMIWDPDHPDLCTSPKGAYVYCDPMKVRPAPDHLFRNDGGRFVDVTATAGCTETEGRGLGVVASDLDGDNLIDLYVANDGTANYFFHNKGNLRFEEIALQAGVAGSAEGGFQAGMGVACGDLDGDGRPDVMVTNFYGEGTTLYQNLGDALFADRSAASGIGLATRYLLGFGIAMADVTNDGLLDVLIANGHVNDNRPYYLYAMPSRLYENRPDGRLVDVSSEAGPAWKVERIGRGLAAGDIDNDGLLDALVLSQNSPVAFFHNKSKEAGNFVTLQLVGTKSNRDGVGARVSVTSRGRRQIAQRQGGGSYQSAGDPRLHFGLGDADRVQQVEIRWPAGRTDHWDDLPANTGYVLREGQPTPLPLAGFAGRQPDRQRPTTNP